MNSMMSTERNPEPPDAPRPAPRRDAGFTLPEVLIAIGLTGTLVLTIVAAAFTLIRVSSVSNDQAMVEATLGAAADKLVQEGWQSCPVETDIYEQKVRTVAANVGWPESAVTVVGIEYWDIGANDWSVTNPFYNPDTATCGPIPTTAAASRMQRVTVRASAPAGAQSRTLQVVVAEIEFIDEEESTS